MMGLKPKYKLFADTFLKTGDSIAAYQKAYPKATKESARVKSYSLLQNDYIKSYISNISDKITAKTQEKLIEAVAQREVYPLLTALEKREMLAKIARGEVYIPVKKPMWDSEGKRFVYVDVMEVADHSTRMKAIDLENKMSGDEAPKKSEVKVVEEIDYSKLSDSALDEIIKAKREN